MTQAEAATLVAKLFAAFAFHQDRDELTAAVYVQHFATMQDAAIALEAVDACIRTERYMPAVATVIEVYSDIARRRSPRLSELEPPGPTEEDREMHLAQARQFLSVLDTRQRSMRGDEPSEEKRKREAANRL